MKKGTKCVRGRASSLSDSALECLGLSPNPQLPPQESTCNFRDLPKRYEETLSRHRIHLTRKGFPLKSKPSHKATEKTKEGRKHDADQRAATGFNVRLYNKPVLPSKYRPETPFQTFCRLKNEDRLEKRNNTRRDGTPKCFILPDIVKISPKKRTTPKPCKEKSFRSRSCMATES